MIHDSVAHAWVGLHLQETWEGMQEAVDQGLTRSIGVSNFSPEKIDEWFSNARIYPAVNQARQPCTSNVVHPKGEGVAGDVECVHPPIANGCASILQLKYCQKHPYNIGYERAGFKQTGNDHQQEAWMEQS